MKNNFIYSKKECHCKTRSNIIFQLVNDIVIKFYVIFNNENCDRYDIKSNDIKSTNQNDYADDD